MVKPIKVILDDFKNNWTITTDNTQPQAVFVNADNAGPFRQTATSLIPCSAQCAHIDISSGKRCARNCSNLSQLWHDKHCCLPREFPGASHNLQDCAGNPRHRSERPAPSHANWLPNKRMATPEGE